MKISEVASETGIDVSTIRFYERKKLITPARQIDNSYRDYTEEDIERLRQIMLCRKLDMSIEDIRSILEEEISFPAMLESQLTALEEKQRRLTSSLELCRKMIADNANGTDDVSFYLNYVATEEKKGHTFPGLLPLLDELAEASDLPTVVGYPVANMILKNKLLRRLIGIGLFAVLIVFPIWMMLQHIQLFVSGEYGGMRLLCLLVVAIMMIGVFVEIVKRQY